MQGKCSAPRWIQLSALIFFAAAGPGCQPQPLWPFKPKDAPTAPQADSGKSQSGRSTSPQAAGSIQLVNLMLDVVRAEFPEAETRNSRKVWNHVDQLRIDPPMQALLARNGIRMGIASHDAWSPLGAIFESSKVATGRDQLAAQPGLPMVISMGKISETESVFFHGPDGRLTGKTFGGGEKVLTLDYAIRPELGGVTDLVIRFEVRQDRGVMTWERQSDGTTRQVPSVDRFIFEPLDVPVTLRPREFLVIGLSDATGEHLLGGRFFDRSTGSGAVEILLCIAPGQFSSQAELRSRS